MSHAPGRSSHSVAKIDIVGDRHDLLLVGMAGVFVTCLGFGVARLALTLTRGTLTSWWADLVGVLAVLALYFWYRRRPAARSVGAAHGTAFAAMLAILAPVAYGVSSTIWWLGLVGFAMVLFGRQREAWAWGLAVPALTVAAVLAGPYVQVDGTTGKPPLELGLTEVTFVVVLVAMALGFRRVAVRRARALQDSEERYRGLFDRAPVGIVHFDTEMRITDCNERFASILGRGREGLVGYDLDSFEEQRVLPALRAALAGAHGEYEGLFSANAARPDMYLAVRTAPLHGEDATVVGAIAILEDITEHRRMEEELRRSRGELEDRVRARTEELQRLNLTLSESEKRYRLIAENTADVIWVLDPATGRFTYVSPSVEKLRGYTAEEQMAQPLSEAVTPESLDLIKEVMAVRLAKFLKKGRGTVNFADELEQPCRDGSVASTEVTTTYLFNERGKVEIVGVSRDITERKKADRALQESEARFRGLVENSLTGVYIVQDGRFVYVNPALAATVGYTQEELIGQNALMVIHPDDRALVAENLRRRMAGEVHTLQYGFRGLRKNGGTVEVEVLGAAMELGGRPAVIGNFLDLTESNMTRAALAESEARYRLLFESAGDAIFLMKDNRYVDCNSRSLAMFGCDVGDIIGHQPAEISPETQRDGSPSGLAAEGWINAALAGKPQAFQWLHRRKDGTLIDTEVGLNRVDLGGERYLLSIVRDVTARVRLEEQLRQAQKMEAIGRLAGGIAHDFNNLLQTLLTHAQLLRVHAADAVHVCNELSELEQDVGRGAALTRQLLLFSRRGNAQLGRVDLGELTRTAAGMLRRLLRENVAFTLELADYPVPVEADRGQLEQVLMNLVVNASDAMPSGGRLVIRTGCNGSEGSWFEVEDSGHGIPKAIQEQIFEPFFTTKGPGKGTGLGLSVVHGIATQHRGRVELESREGQGSRFRIVLPRAEAGEPIPVAMSASAAATGLAMGAGERVLIVEDEEGAREGLKEILRSLGYQVEAAGSGGEARALASKPEFALLLTDLMLPDVAGHELAAGLVTRWPHMAVILMSGYTEDEVVRRGIEAGRMRFLQKPFDMQTLASSVRLALDHRAQLVSLASS